MSFAERVLRRSQLTPVCLWQRQTDEPPHTQKQKLCTLRMNTAKNIFLNCSGWYSVSSYSCKNANNHMVSAIITENNKYNSFSYWKLSIFSVIGLSDVTKWFPAFCKLHIVTHSSRRLYTGCPQMHKNSNYPWLGRLRTHQCQSLPLCYIDSTVWKKQQQPIIRPRGDPTTLKGLQISRMLYYARNLLEDMKSLSLDAFIALSMFLIALAIFKGKLTMH